jgi:hypothetical protein
MTELLDTDLLVRTGPGGALTALQLEGRWVEIERVVAVWRVETDWWRPPVRRDYWRCLLRGDEETLGECVELCRDHALGRWALVRRYD